MSASLPECVRGEWEQPGVCGYEQDLWLGSYQDPVVLRNLKTLPGHEAALCNGDVALVLLEAPAPEPFVPARVRREAMGEAEEGLIAAGYGLDGNGEDPYACLETAPLAVAAGPGHAIAVDPEEASAVVDESVACLGQTLGSTDPATATVGLREFALREATCHGDSGGPVFDAHGRVAGVTSRGSFRCAGEGAWSVFSDVGQQARLFDDALAWLHETLASDAGDYLLAPVAF
jgi:hypothetical protein